MADLFQGMSAGLDSPANRHFAITAADADMAIIPRSIRCSVGGTAIIRDAGGVDVTYTLVAGEILPFRAVQVRVGSTATLIGWY